MSGIIEATTSQLRSNNSHCIKQHAEYIIIRGLQYIARSIRMCIL